MAKQGAFTFVLHSHIPYCRQAGRWPHGEEWIHEAAAETYVPLLNALYDLVEEGLRPSITIGITPILAEQLADADIVDHFQEYLLEKIAAAEKDIARLEALEVAAEAHATLQQAETEALQAAHEIERERVESLDEPVEKRSAEAVEELEERLDEGDAAMMAPIPADLDAAADEDEAADQPEGEPTTQAAAGAPAEAEPLVEPPDPHRLYLARWYRDWYATILRSFTERFQHDIVGSFRHLQDIGAIEIITSMATHCYTPLLSRDSSIYGQLATGIASYVRHFGRKPRAIWLPECAYRPAYVDEASGAVRPGVEAFLAAQGIGCFFSETHLVEGGRPVGKAADEAIGPYAAIRRKYVLPHADYVEPSERTTYQPYLVSGVDVAVIGRNDRTGSQVWSGAQGYPGEASYREFHKKDSFSGLQYWRVSGPDVDLGEKEYWHPEWAEERVASHAEHFVGLVEQLLGDYASESGRFGLISSNYDTDLFGHWWFEGVAWLKATLRGLARSDIVELTTASAFLEAHPAREVLQLPEGSWGSGGTHYTWLNPDNEWIWPLIHTAERTMERLAAQHANTDGDLEFALAQVARELVLLQSSDWPFLIATGQAREYSEGRFAEHLARFHRLVAAVDSGNIGEARELANQYAAMDNPFPQIDYRVFAEREGRPG
jgi:1,4-alpha-glucan branching enzyme